MLTEPKTCALPILTLVSLFVLLILVGTAKHEMTQPQRNQALIAAIKRDDADAVIALLNAGADPNTFEDFNAEHSLWENLPLFRTYLLSPQTALVVALEKDKPSNPAIYHALLEHGAKVNFPAQPYIGTDTHLATPLFAAIMNPNYGAIPVLLKYGANVNVADTQGRTALMWAAQHDRDTELKEFLDAGAKINTQDHFGETALMFAVEISNESNVKFLLQHGADCNKKTHPGSETALSLNQGENHEQIEKMLKAAGAKK